MKQVYYITLAILLLTGKQAVSSELPTVSLVNIDPISWEKVTFAEKLKELKAQNNQQATQEAYDLKNSCGLTPLVNSVIGSLRDPLTSPNALLAGYFTYQTCKRANHNLPIHEKIKTKIATLQAEYESPDWQPDRESKEEEQIRQLRQQLRYRRATTNKIVYKA
jgi:hypothetical protein